METVAIYLAALALGIGVNGEINEDKAYKAGAIARAEAKLERIKERGTNVFYSNGSQRSENAVKAHIRRIEKKIERKKAKLAGEYSRKRK